MAAKFKIGALVKSKDATGKNPRHYKVAAIIEKTTVNKHFVSYKLNPVAQGELIMDEKSLIAV